MYIILVQIILQQYGKTFNNPLLETKLLPDLREIKFLRVMEQLDKRSSSTCFRNGSGSHHNGFICKSTRL